MAEGKPKEDARVQWIKKGGGTALLIIGGKRKPIKPGQRFWALPEEVPKGFRDIIVPVSGLPTEVPLTSNTQFKVVPKADADLTPKQKELMTDLETPVEKTDVEEIVDDPAARVADKDTKDQIAPDEGHTTAESEPETEANEDNAQVTQVVIDGVNVAEVGGADHTPSTVANSTDPQHVIEHRGGPWFNVINIASGKPINDKPLNKSDAEEVLRSL